MSRPRAPRLTLTLAATAGLVLAAVLALTGSERTVAVGPSRTVDVAVSEYRLRPDSIRAHAGFLDIHVRNFGRLTHNLEVRRSGQRVNSTPPIAPGQSAELYLTLDPGSYTMDSSLFSDEALGAYGTIKVTG